MMKQEGLGQKGHLSMVNSLIKELNGFHDLMLGHPAEIKYQEQYHWAKPNISDFRAKINQPQMNDIEVSLHAMYSLLLLRLKKTNINQDTAYAMSTFSNLLALLAGKFKLYEEGRLEI
ncbi:MAG: DUF4924 family protein [Bacteroidales bacterium]|nr:DUF4924 family protein [Bacteroidales bacterium]